MTTPAASIEEALAQAMRCEGEVVLADFINRLHPTLSRKKAGGVVRRTLAAHPLDVRKVKICRNMCFVAPDAVARMLPGLIVLPGRRARPQEPEESEEDDVEELQEPPPASSLVADAQPPSDAPLDFTGQMSALLGHPVITPRTTSDGRVALIDVARIFTGFNNNLASRAVQRVLEQYPEVTPSRSNFTFPGRGQRPVHVAPLATAIEFAFLLPGRHAASVRRSAATLLVCFLGGDLSLVGEVERINRVQAQLRGADEAHPLRAFGAAVEAEASVEAQAVSREAAPAAPIELKPRPDPQVIRAADSVGVPGAAHLYAAQRLSDGSLKLGNTTQQLMERLGQLQQTFKDQYALTAVWPHEGMLEDIVRDLLQTAKAEVGTSREHFNVSFEQLHQMVDLARKLYLAQQDVAGDEDRVLKRRRLELDLEERAVWIERTRADVKRMNADPDSEVLRTLVLVGDLTAKEVFLARLRPYV